MVEQRDSNSDLTDSRLPSLTKALITGRKDTYLLQADNEEENGFG